MGRQVVKQRGLTQVLAGAALALIAEVIVAVVVGAVLSWMVTRGWLSYEQMEKGSGIALLVAGMAGGMLLCCRWKRMPLLWGIAAGGLLTILCLACGAATSRTEMIIRGRVFLPLVGGSLAGVVTAVKR